MSRLLTKSLLAAIASAVVFTSAAHAGDKNDKDSHKKHNDHSNSASGLVHEVIDWSKTGHKKDGLVHEGIDWSNFGHKHDGCDKPTVPPIDPGPGNGPIVVPIDPGTGNGQTSTPTHVIRDHRGEGKVVRDHRTNAGTNAAGGVTVGTSGATTAGGVTVTGTATGGKIKNPNMGNIPPRPAPTAVPAWGSGAIVRDHRGTGKPNDVIGVGPGPVDVIEGVGNAIGDAVGAVGSVFGLGEGSITGAAGSSKPTTDYHVGPIVRDHRTNPAPTNGGPIIRDHRN
jgi:hypothetical protein